MKRYRIPEIARKYVEYDLIQKHTKLPEFPDSRVRLLFAFLNKSPVSSANSELFALVTSLVQMGLDTHDLIEPANIQQAEREMRSRQFKVLAGDYYSSRFYHLLSQAGQIDTIRTLSGAICEVNRLKVNLYVKMKQCIVTAEEYLQQLVQLKMQLFVAFSKLFDDKDAKPWSELLRAFTHCEVLQGELGKNEQVDTFAGSWAYWHIWHQGTDEELKSLRANGLDAAALRAMLLKYDIRNKLVDKLSQTVEHIQTVLRELDSEKLLNELMLIGEPFVRLVRHSAPALREG
ncbi:hypothetical protein PAE9249_01238 [Paenibacillus sp. CECT 9249]|uniref:heptaprenyl diphosphate synthase component 1 n=1 Tax=Paenibacillus sp. CECT 9249 TaxID=2845385 RepID=UPI001E336721|nr:heptaprenyl diphosphate synthase component 1 [Paenibacillus sp. CECT 9249]CAH0118744.1 hypothetical protein PAE9249_01238 [Paenibacillus sp. CECT 9249]